MTDARVPHEHHFPTHDAVSLFYRHWPATGGTPRGAIVLFHRGHEHGARMAHLVDELDLPDFDFFAWDARGHGQSPGAARLQPELRDLGARRADLRRPHRSDHGDRARGHRTSIAQSVGAVLVATWAHDYAPQVRALMLASPAFKVKLYVPFARAGLGLHAQAARQCSSSTAT